MKKTIYINQTSENKNKYRNKISYKDFEEKAEDTESEAVEFIQIQHQKTKKYKKKLIIIFYINQKKIMNILPN